MTTSIQEKKKTRFIISFYNKAIQGKTKQCKAMQSNAKQYLFDNINIQKKKNKKQEFVYKSQAIQSNTKQYKAIQSNTYLTTSIQEKKKKTRNKNSFINHKQYKAIQSNTKQYTCFNLI